MPKVLHPILLDRSTQTTLVLTPSTNLLEVNVLIKYCTQPSSIWSLLLNTMLRIRILKGKIKIKKWQNSERETVANDLITVERRKGKTKPTTCLFWHPRPSTRLFVNIIWTTLFDFGCKLVLETLWLIFEFILFHFSPSLLSFCFCKN